MRLAGYGIVFFLLAGPAAADEPGARRFPLPKHGSFELKVPASWQASVEQPPNDLPPTFSFSPASGAPFQVLVTPVWAAGPQVKLPGPAELKSSVSRAAAETAKQSVEKNIAIKELNGASGQGYYYSATDPAPKPGEYKFLTQGMLASGDLRVSFAILTNDGQDAVVRDALAMVASAVHRP